MPSQCRWKSWVWLVGFFKKKIKVSQLHWRGPLAFLSVDILMILFSVLSSVCFSLWKGKLFLFFLKRREHTAEIHVQFSVYTDSFLYVSLHNVIYLQQVYSISPKSVSTDNILTALYKLYSVITSESQHICYIVQYVQRLFRCSQFLKLFCIMLMYIQFQSFLSLVLALYQDYIIAYIIFSIHSKEIFLRLWWTEN